MELASSADSRAGTSQLRPITKDLRKRTLKKIERHNKVRNHMKKLKHRKRERLNECIKTEEDSSIVHFYVHCQYLQVFVGCHTIGQ